VAVGQAGRDLRQSVILDIQALDVKASGVTVSFLLLLEASCMALDRISITDLERMRRSVDPRVNALSFSGADYQAVVFLPIDKSKLSDELFLLRQKRILAQDEEVERGAAWATYSERIDYNTQQAQIAWETAEAYAKLGNQTLERQWRKTYTEYQYLRQQDILSRDRQGGTPSEKLANEQEILGYSAEIEKLERALKKGENYSRAITLGDVQTITWSTFRDKKPVRTFGRVNPKARTRGQRTIAGSLIFTVFNKTSLWELLQAHTALANTGVRRNQGGVYPTTEGVLADQLPPFDISIIASNEIGDNSAMVIYGVEIHSEGTTLSIQDMLTEDVMQFTAADIDVLRSVGERRLLAEPGKVDKLPNAKTASNELSDALKRRQARLNPFI
jgi:hypothetical protein